ncbi:MAG: VWA domain-containing protein [Candidatus Lokiarchaeota archaeon]|nr:VWA domain-containing protein [Candidatus Lokiarchaeota archaeon]
MQVTRSEDCLIFYALTPGSMKGSQVRGEFQHFLNLKQQNDPSDRFNIIAFQEDGPTYLDHFTLDQEIVLSALKAFHKTVTRANIAGGIFVAITFIIEVFKKISEKIFRLVILLDDKSYKIPEHYLPVLEDLIDKVKDMPFFIDVVYLNAIDAEECRKLQRLSGRTKGDYYEISTMRDLSAALTILSEKKRIKVANFYNKQKPVIIQENQPFYVNLADEPIVVNELTSCAICFQKDDTGLVKCPSCDTVAHMTCLAQWAKISNIGISHVFRCHICYNILKLDEQFVLDVHAGKIPTREQMLKLQKKDLVRYMQELEEKDKPRIVQVIDPLAIEQDESEDVIVVEDEIVEPIRNKPKIKIVICPNCSRFTTSIKQECPMCGFKLF